MSMTIITLKPTALALGTAWLLCAPMAVGQNAPPAATSAQPSPTASKTAAKRAATGKAASASGFRDSTPVTVNFVNAEIEAVTRAMGAMLNRQFIVDPRVKGQITVYGDQPMRVSDAYTQYLAALRGLGFTVVENAGLYKVLPEADAKLQGDAVQIGAASRRGDQVVTQIFKLNHENPNNLVPVLRPLISPNNTINANAASQTLVITDYADNLRRIAKMIAAMDAPATGEPEVIGLKHAVASDMAALVQRLATGQGAAVPGAPGAVAVGSGGLAVIADPRSNSLIVTAPTLARMAQVKGIIERLDKPSNGGPGGQVWVVHLRNSDAVRLATVLRAAFATPGQQGGGGGGAPQPGQNIPAPNLAGAQGGGAGGGGIATQPLQASAGVQTGGFIQADPATNSLIITAPEPLYRQVRNAIDQLDSRRAQVVVESMIVKVDASKAAEIGVQWQGLLGNNGDKTLLGAGTNFGAGSNNIVSQGIGVARATDANGNVTGASLASSGLGIPGAGFNIGLVRKFGGLYTLGSLARLLETSASGNVLSTPTLVALDNEEAQIVIGQNVPFVTGSYVNTGGAGTALANPFQTIERKDVGLTLRVKPQIGENGTIRMTVYQENSTVVPGSSSSLTGPTTDKSAIATSVIVDDGSIMVLGGLLKDEYTDGDDKIPGLGDVPVVGNAFKSQNRRRIKSNLLVFLRPVVVRTQADSDALTIDRYESIRAQQRNVETRDGTPTPLLPPAGPPNAVTPGALVPQPPRTPSASGEGKDKIPPPTTDVRDPTQPR
jgi:general secretion pathway protein D